MQHTFSVAIEVGHARHRRILPQRELVLRVAVPRQDFLLVRRPHQRADLRASVDVLHASAGRRVPELDATIRRAAAGREQARIVRAPCHSLDSSAVRIDLVARRIAALVPYVQQVVIAARRKLRAVVVPLQAAHLLLVARQSHRVVLTLAHVVVEDVRVPRPSAEHPVVPCHRADTCRVSLERAHLLGLLHVP